MQLLFSFMKRAVRLLIINKYFYLNFIHNGVYYIASLYSANTNIIMYKFCTIMGYKNISLSNSLYIASLSACNALCKRASEICLNTNLAEDASTDIHYGSKNGSERNSNERRKCIHP